MAAPAMSCLKSALASARRALPYAVLIGSGLYGFDAQAQTPGCTATELTDPPRQVLACADGLTITAERGAAYQLMDRNRDGKPDAAQLSGRGLLIELPSQRRGGFQILTPHAIAAVRGTVWAVDVSPERTSVFVQQGVVAVRRPDSADGVTLRAGDGVDVNAGAGALEVKRWSPQRAAALLARFGR